jgi:hypothetical protein
MPKPGAEIAVAVARLQPVTEPSGHQPAAAPVQAIHRTLSDQQKALKRCGVLCKDGSFISWLRRTNNVPLQVYKDPAELVREVLQCGSRRDIATDPDVYARWQKLADAYDMHLRYPGRA